MKPTPFSHPKWKWRCQVAGRYYPDGKRKTKYFETKEAADKFASQLDRFGLAAVESKAPVAKPAEDQFSLAARDLARLFDGDVAKLYQAAERIAKSQNIKTGTVREVVEIYQAERQDRVNAKKLAASTYDAERWRILKLLNAFEEIELVALTPALLHEFFAKVPGDLKSIHKTINQFFLWATQRNYLFENPMVRITAKSLGASYGINDEFYPVETFRRMLRIAAGLEPVKPGGAVTRDYIDLLPWFVLSGFLGLRSCEAFRLTRAADSIRWDDLKLAATIPYIDIRSEVAKRTKRKSDQRGIQSAHALAAVEAWLALVPRHSAHIVRWTKRNIQDLKAEFSEATGIKFANNGLRNSFATYGLSISGLEGVGRMALEMGNSEAICKRHYVSWVAPGTGRAWFGLRPFEVVQPVAAEVA